MLRFDEGQTKRGCLCRVVLMESKIVGLWEWAMFPQHRLRWLVAVVGSRTKNTAEADGYTCERGRVTRRDMTVRDGARSPVQGTDEPFSGGRRRCADGATRAMGRARVAGRGCGFGPTSSRRDYPTRKRQRRACRKRGVRTERGACESARARISVRAHGDARRRKSCGTRGRGARTEATGAASAEERADSGPARLRSELGRDSIGPYRRSARAAVVCVV